MCIEEQSSNTVLESYLINIAQRGTDIQLVANPTYQQLYVHSLMPVNVMRLILSNRAVSNSAALYFTANNL